MANVYHVLFKPPRLEREDMYVETERLAEQLLHSGRLRIEAEDRGNFIRVSNPLDKVQMMLSRRELFSPHLLPKTEQRLAAIFQKKYPANGGLDRAREEIKRLRK